MTPSEEGLPEPAAGSVATDADDRSQLDWEARAGRPAAAAAFGAALLPLVGTAVFVAALSGASEEDAGLFVAIDGAPVGVIASAVLRAIGILLLPIALGYLYRAVRVRRPEAPSFALPLLVAGSVGLAAAIVLFEALRVDLAAEFVAGGSQTEAVADTLSDESAAEVVTYVQLGLGVPFGIGIILIALNAMRAGLLGRFMGIIGIGVGVFYIVPLAGPTLILLFWGVALGVLFLGRWPGGERGPAWSRVEAVPWPTAADRLQAQRDARVEEAQDAARGESEPAESAPAPRPQSRKRRRGR